ncbi:MAG TPA: hypothetical protein PKH07_00640, partial [bacterium]|nr:hypothetical protein [bacterium]
PAVPSSQIESMHLDELLRQINQEWDLTRYSLESKRRNFAQVVTGFKKMLDVVLKPYANIFLYQQATYNSHVVQILNLLGQKLGRVESFLAEIANEQTALRVVLEGKVDEINRKLDLLGADFLHKHEQTQAALAEGFDRSQQGLEAQRQHFEQAHAHLREEVGSQQENTRQRMEQGFAQSQSLLEQQKQYMDQVQNQIMDDLADGLRISLTEVAQRLQAISSLAEKNQKQLEEKFERNMDALLALLTEERQGTTDNTVHDSQNE